jgi:hypothetical protein
MPMNPDLNGHPAIQSIRRDGFLSEAIDQTVPSLRAMHPQWFDFAERSNRVGQRMMNSAERACVGRTIHDPVCLATRLLIRTLSGYQGAILLAERGMTLEAESLVRGLYENSLWMGFLNRAPAAAVEAMLVDELWSQKGRDGALLRQIKQVADPGQELVVLRQALETRIVAAVEELAGRRRHSIDRLAQDSGFDGYYPYYKMLSSGSAHPSFHSLSKHLQMNDDGTWSGHVTGPDGDGIGQSLTLASHALLASLAAFNGVWPGGDGAREVQALLEEHLVLAGVATDDQLQPAGDAAL